MVAQVEYIAQIVERLERAAAANLADPGREGAVVSLSDADEVMITGDLHGHRKNFNQIRKIAELDCHPRRHLIMQEVVHGGPKYDNGGCMSHAMLEDVAKLMLDFPDRVHFLLSNHELSELTGYPIQKGGALLNLQFRLGLAFMYGPAADQVLGSMHNFIRSCPLAVRWDGGAFACHSTPEGITRTRFDAGVFTRPWTKIDLDPHGAVFELVWGRDYTEANAQAFAELVHATVLLTGHEPNDGGYAMPNSHQVIFDCCHSTACYAIMPVNEPATQQSILARIQKL